MHALSPTLAWFNESLEIEVPRDTGEHRYRDFQVHDMIEGLEGEIWFGLWNGSILHYSDSESMPESSFCRLFTEADGLSQGVGPRLCRTSDNDIWVISDDGDHGIARFDGHSWNSIRSLVSEMFAAAQPAYTTKAGALWLNRVKVESLNLSELVLEMKPLLQMSISKKNTLKYSIAADLPSIEVDSAQVQQIVMNLIINASEATEGESGVIDVRAGVEFCDRAYLTVPFIDEELPEGQYVYLEVVDNGCGMTEETRLKLFDPFFTTKFTGRGLGMAAVLGIVRGHRGTIKVWSETGKGTRFKVHFPVSNKIVNRERNKEEEATGQWRSSGTVLIVDDEEPIRALAREILETIGFTVLTATDGGEGVEVFQNHADEIRLVILDMTMPQLNGEETFRDMERIRSGVPTILMSGFTEQKSTIDFAGFIRKPFVYNEMLEIIRNALNS